MGVYIKGMEMPKDCPFCPMSHWNKLDTLTGCDATPGKRYVRKDEVDYWHSSTRPDWCPLVPVPAHGRLIDADELRNDWLENGENAYIYDTNSFLWSLDDAPTVIPAEPAEEGKT